ncbi:Homeobox domain containing protein, partial [Reticulomyxa filosa]
TVHSQDISPFLQEPAIATDTVLATLIMGDPPIEHPNLLISNLKEDSIANDDDNDDNDDDDNEDIDDDDIDDIIAMEDDDNNGNSEMRTRELM